MLSYAQVLTKVMSPPLLLYFLACVVQLGNVSGSPTSAIIDLRTAKQVFEVDEKFLSFTIDSHGLLKGWQDFSLEDQRLIYLAKSLAPAYLRLGGTDADLIDFVPHLSPKDTKRNAPEDDGEYSCRGRDRIPAIVPGSDFLPLGHFVHAAGLDLVYGLNALQRTKKGWKSENSEGLLDYFGENAIKVAGLELGNEPDSFFHVFNTTVASSALARDFIMLKNITDKRGMYNVRIIGPDITRPTGPRSRSMRYLKGFLKHGGSSAVDTVSFHQYYFDGRTAVAEDFTNVTIMNVLEEEVGRVKSAVHRFTSGKRIWLGETSSGWGGGCVNVSDRFASSFMWLDKLGQAARLGVSNVFRQSLIGGYYGLVGRDSKPTPDYFVSLLHKRLVGRRVLSAEIRADRDLPAGLRLYFHCSSQSNAITIFGINVGRSSLTVRIRGRRKKKKKRSEIQEYLLQAPSLTSEFAYLNGVQLKVDADGKLPELRPIRRRSSSFMFPSNSIGFWVVDAAVDNAALCAASSQRS